MRFKTAVFRHQDRHLQGRRNLLQRDPIAAPLTKVQTDSLDKLAALLKASTEKLTVSFSGADTAVCQVPVVELAKRGALQNVTVDDQCGRGDYAITVSPIPDVR